MESIELGGKTVRVFQVCESEAVAAETLEEAYEFYKDTTGLDEDDLYPIEQIETVNLNTEIYKEEGSKEKMKVRDMLIEEWKGLPFIAITSY